MKFQPTDSAWFDDTHLLVVYGYTEPDRTYYTLYNPVTNGIYTGMWESDLLTHDEYRELCLDWGQSGPVVI